MTSSLSKIFERLFLMEKPKGETWILGLQDFFIKKFNFAWDDKLRHQDFFVEKPHLKLENFIPKGILLIGPPGTGENFAS